MQGDIRPAIFESLEARQLGPLLESVHLSLCGVLPSLTNINVATNPVSQIVRAIYTDSECWSGPNGAEEVALIRVRNRVQSYEDRLVQFFVRAQTAGHRVARLSKDVARNLVIAMRELESNIFEHAEAQDTGVLSFRAELGVFEFVVADLGIGILNSLQSKGDFLYLRDEGSALRAALTEGVSRYGRGSRRGFGFRPIFQGLIDHHGELRFRSGDHALMIENIQPQLASARIAQKSRIQGFFASVRCTTPNQHRSRRVLN